VEECGEKYSSKLRISYNYLTITFRRQAYSAAMDLCTHGHYKNPAISALFQPSNCCHEITYSAPPVDEEILKTFYKNIRPWGFWGPIKDKVMTENPEFTPSKDFKRDMTNVVVGTIWQTALVIFPIYLVLLETVPTLISIAVALICTYILKKNWFDHLPA